MTTTALLHAVPLFGPAMVLACGCEPEIEECDWCTGVRALNRILAKARPPEWQAVLDVASPVTYSGRARYGHLHCTADATKGSAWVTLADFTVPAAIYAGRRELLTAGSALKENATVQAPT